MNIKEFSKKTGIPISTISKALGNYKDVNINTKNKITELNSKLTIAMRMGNSSLINQVQMALTTYRNKLSEKHAEARNKDDKFEDKIDIS